MYRGYERYCCKENTMNIFENTAKFVLLNEMVYDGEKTELQLSGLDPEKLEFMRMDERRKVLIEAGLNPDCYDF